MDICASVRIISMKKTAKNQQLLALLKILVCMAVSLFQRQHYLRTIEK